MGTLGTKLQHVLNEPGCATNQAKPISDRKKGCNKLLAPVPLPADAPLTVQRSRFNRLQT